MTLKIMYDIKVILLYYYIWLIIKGICNLVDYFIIYKPHSCLLIYNSYRLFGYVLVIGCYVFILRTQYFLNLLTHIPSIDECKI